MIVVGMVLIVVAVLVCVVLVDNQMTVKGERMPSMADTQWGAQYTRAEYEAAAGDGVDIANDGLTGTRGLPGHQ